MSGHRYELRSYLWKGEPFLCVQRRLAHPAGDKPAGVKVKPP